MISHVLVYLITNSINGTCYVGKTVKTAKQRWTEHVSAALRGSRTAFYRAIRKYSPAAFDLSEVCYASTNDQLCLLEQAVIAAFRAAGIPLYNITAGGDGWAIGQKHSKKSKLKMSEARKRAWDISPNPPISEVTRALMRASHQGLKHTAEAKAKIGASHRGKHYNIGNQSRLGKPITAEAKSKISTTMRALRAAKFWSTKSKIHPSLST